MKNKIVLRLLSCALLITLFVIIAPQSAQTQTATYPIRNLTLDTLGKTLLLTGTEADRDGTLKEFSNNNQLLKNWKIKYEHKGSSRRMCEPPVLNLSFDKKDSKGKNKELFTGVSTYAGYSALQYQKVRMIPECDIWNDYFNSAGDIGFSGQLNVSLREYIIFKIFRKFGIPTADIVGFANVTFVAPDSGYNGKSFRYMIVQKPSEQDDQIPFTKQYKLNSSLYESGISPWNIADYNKTNRLTSATLANRNDNSVVPISFDPDTTIKFLLLTDFLSLSDMGYLHNEDWGTDPVTGKTKIIPHGFDASFYCNFMDPSGLEITRLVNDLPDSTRSSYQAIYYQITREIFGNSASLNQMIALVNEFPYRDVDKLKLIEYLKINFYQYASYFNSAEFATSLNLTYQPQSISLPFTSETEYRSHQQAFSQSCYRTKKVLSGVSVSVIGNPTLVSDSSTPVEACPVGSVCPQEKGSPTENFKRGQANFTIEIKTTDSAVEMSKSRFRNAFNMNLVGAGDNNKDNKNLLQVEYVPIAGTVEDYSGPYYIIPPNSTVRFSLNASIRSWELLKDTYFVQINSFQPNNNTEPFAFQAKTNNLNLGFFDPIEIISPKSDDTLAFGKEQEIKWGGTPNQAVNIMISSINGLEWYLSKNPDKQSMAYDNNIYSWTVGKIYDYKYNEEKGNGSWELTDLKSGKYKISIYYDGTNIRADSGYFRINSSGNDYGNPEVSVLQSTSTPSLHLEYNDREKEKDRSKKDEEVALKANFAIDIKAGNDDQHISKQGYFNIRASDGKNTMWSVNTLYSKPSNVEENVKASMYIIRAGTTARFKVEARFNPKMMFAGTYRASFDGVNVQNDTDGWTYLQAPTNQTRPVVIVGEVSPYINSISPSPAPSNQTMTISGVRFAPSGNIVSFFDTSSWIETKKIVNSSGNGQTIQFVSNMPVGNYYVNVTHPTTGQSNWVFLKVLSNLTISFKNSPLVPSQNITIGTSAPIGGFIIVPSDDPVLAKDIKFKINISGSGGTAKDLQDIKLLDSNRLISNGTVDLNYITFPELTLPAGQDKIYTIRATLGPRFKAKQTIQLSANFYKDDASFTGIKTGTNFAVSKSGLILSKMTAEDPIPIIPVSIPTILPLVETSVPASVPPQIPPPPTVTQTPVQTTTPITSSGPAVISTPPPVVIPAPTATLTVEGQKSYTYNVTQATHYIWSSTNADTFSSSFSFPPSNLACSLGAWTINTAEGTKSNTITSDLAGCVWTITYTAKNSATGQSASDSVTVTVANGTTDGSGTGGRNMTSNVLNAFGDFNPFKEISDFFDALFRIQI